MPWLFPALAVAVAASASPSPTPASPALAVAGSATDVANERARTLDFGAGFVVGEPAIGGHDGVPGLLVLLRAYPGGGLGRGWTLSAQASVEPSIDARDPERAELALTWAGGLAVGGFIDLRLDRPRITGHLDVRTELVAVDPGAAREAVLWGARVGPTVGLGVVVAHAFGHPMSLEARVGIDRRWGLDPTAAAGASGTSARAELGAHVALALVGVLLPDRP